MLMVRLVPDLLAGRAAAGGRVSEALTAATAPRILAAVATKARHRANYQGVAASDCK
jgi:hypothetical protein